MAVVLVDGVVAAGDHIAVEVPVGSHRPLGPV
jgi:hypothetical protein